MKFVPPLLRNQGCGTGLLPFQLTKRRVEDRQPTWSHDVEQLRRADIFRSLQHLTMELPFFCLFLYLLFSSQSLFYAVAAASQNASEAAAEELRRTLLWGPYRPNLYFGLRPRIPNSLLMGIMWARVEDFTSVQQCMCLPLHPRRSSASPSDLRAGLQPPHPTLRLTA